MLIVAYDISNNKVRLHFSKFLLKYGHRIQYSVFQIKFSKRVLENIITEINLRYKSKFTGADSVIIFHLGAVDKVQRFGYAANEDKEILML